MARRDFSHQGHQLLGIRYSHSCMAASGECICSAFQPRLSPSSIIWYWPNGWEVDRHAVRCTSPISVVVQCKLIRRSVPPTRPRGTERTFLLYETATGVIVGSGSSGQHHCDVPVTGHRPVLPATTVACTLSR